MTLKKYKSMKDYLKDHPEDEEVRDELEAYEDGFKEGSLLKEKEMLDKFEKMIDEVATNLINGIKDLTSKQICNNTRRNNMRTQIFYFKKEVKERLQKLQGAKE